MKRAPDAPRAVPSGVVGVGVVALCMVLFVYTGNDLLVVLAAVIVIGTIANARALWRNQIPPSKRDPDRP